MSDETANVSVHAGFPNPASDRSLGALDFNQLLIEHGASTYTFRVQGQEWQKIGVFDGDLAVVDRALDAHKNDIVIWWHEEEFAISYLHDTPKDAAIWGVVTATIHKFHPKNRKPKTANG